MYLHDSNLFISYLRLLFFELDVFNYRSFKHVCLVPFCPRFLVNHLLTHISFLIGCCIFRVRRPGGKTRLGG